MGTVGYMSPEQVRGERRTSVRTSFSFGAILHEMITGRRAFRRDTVAETMTAILKEEPEDLSASIPTINPALERIVERCLEKKPERRFHTAHDLGFALESLSAPTTSSGRTVSTIATAEVETERSVWRARIPWIAFAVAALIAIAALPLLMGHSGIHVRPLNCKRFALILLMVNALQVLAKLPSLLMAAIWSCRRLMKANHNFGSVPWTP